IRPPAARVGPISPEERKAVIAKSPIRGKYDQAVDPESAYEILHRRVSERDAAEAAPAPENPAEAPGSGGGLWGEIVGGVLGGATGATKGRRARMTTTEVVVKQVARSVASQVGSQLGRALIRGVLGSLGGQR